MSAPLLPSTTIVDSIVKIEPEVTTTFREPAEPLTVTFRNGPTAILPASAAHYSIYAAILEELKALGIKVYVTKDSNGEITKLLIPAFGHVLSLMRFGDTIG